MKNREKKTKKRTCFKKKNRRQKNEICKSSETRVAEVSRRSEPSSRGKRTFEVRRRRRPSASRRKVFGGAVSGKHWWKSPMERTGGKRQRRLSAESAGIRTPWFVLNPLHGARLLYGGASFVALRWCLQNPTPQKNYVRTAATANFERPFTHRTSLQSPRNFGNARFGRFANFDFLTPKKNRKKIRICFFIIFGRFSRSYAFSNVRIELLDVFRLRWSNF